MAFRRTGICRLMIFVLTLCMLTGAAPSTLGEAEMTEEQTDEASRKAYEEAMLQGETQITFTIVRRTRKDRKRDRAREGRGRPRGGQAFQRKVRLEGA